MGYPRLVISTLITQVDETLIDFYSDNKDKYNFPYADMNDLIDNTLQEYLPESSNAASDLKAVYAMQTRLRRQKKTRWRKSCIDSLAMDLSSNKNAFHFLLEQQELLTVSQFKTLYKYNNIEKVIEELVKQIEEWQADASAYLISFPLISNQTPKQLLTVLKHDLFINLLNVINEKYNGSINSIIRRKPEVLIDNPVFTATLRTIPLQDTLDDFAAELLNTNNMKFEVSAPNTGELTPHLLSQKDSEIISCLIDNITLDFYDSGSVTVPLNVIAKALHNRPNSRHYAELKEKLLNMSKLNFKSSVQDKAVMSFNIFDNILITSDPTGHLICRATFGKVLHNAIMKRKMVGVTSNNFYALELSLSRIIYHALERERIRLSTTSPTTDLRKNYDYSFFERIVIFPKRRKDKNMILIQKSLDEFVKKKICIESYKISNNVFQILFFPLSEDEKADLIDEKAKLIEQSTIL